MFLLETKGGDDQITKTNKNVKTDTMDTSSKTEISESETRSESSKSHSDSKMFVGIENLPTKDYLTKKNKGHFDYRSLPHRTPSSRETHPEVCQCGDGEMLSQRKQEEERKKSEARHKAEVLQQMLPKRRMGSDAGQGIGSRDYSKGRDEDRIVNGYDVSGLARPWHASLVKKHKK